MKMTLDIPDAVLQKAKENAKQLRIPFNKFVAEAIETKLAALDQKPWMRIAGGLKHLKDENARINQIHNSKCDSGDSATTE